MLTLRYRKNVEFVFVTGTLLLILFAEPVLAKKGRERGTNTNQVEPQTQKTSIKGQVPSSVATSSQNAGQETKLNSSKRNNSGRTHKTGVHHVRNAKQRRVAKWRKQRQPREKQYRKQHVTAPLRSSSRLRKRLSFDTRRRMSLDTKRRLSLDTKRRITVFDMQTEDKEPAPKKPPHRKPRHRKPRPKKHRPIAMQK
jgi:hypothetical protein